MKPQPLFNYVVYSIFIGIPLHVSIVYISLSLFCGQGSGCVEGGLAVLVLILMPVLVSIFILANILKNISNKTKMHKIAIYGVIILVPLLYSGQYIYRDFIVPVFFGY